jgi:hypothetical protein
VSLSHSMSVAGSSFYQVLASLTTAWRIRFEFEKDRFTMRQWVGGPGLKCILSHWNHKERFICLFTEGSMVGYMCLNWHICTSEAQRVIEREERLGSEFAK